ncbi:MAG: hypothetical protein ACKVKR_12275 [Pseudomonadales bacterium]
MNMKLHDALFVAAVVHLVIPPKMVGSKSIDAAAIGSTSFGVRVA